MLSDARYNPNKSFMATFGSYKPYWSQGSFGELNPVKDGLPLQSDTEYHKLHHLGHDEGLSSYITQGKDRDSLEHLIREASSSVGACESSPRDHQSSDDDSERKPRRRDRHSEDYSDSRRRRESEDERSHHHNSRDDLAGHLPITIFLVTGIYDLGSGLGTAARLNMIATSFSTSPNAIVRLGRNVRSGGYKSWQGCIFEDGIYTVESSSPWSEERFVNCIFRKGARIKATGGRVIFEGCTIITDGLAADWLSQEGESSIEMRNCDIRTNSNGDKRSGSLIKLAGCNEIANVVTNCRFTIGVKSRAESYSRPFYVFQFGSTQAMQFTNNQVNFTSCQNRIIFFGTWEKFHGINLIATNNTFVNTTPGSLFVSLLGNLWSASASSSPVGTIYISRSTLRNVRLLSFNGGSCHHEVLCTSPEKCEHCNYDYDAWDQTITVTFCDIFLTTPGPDQRSAVVEINGPSGTTWTINILNSNIFVNGSNIPLFVSGIQSAVVNLTGTTITSTSSTMQSAPGPFLVINNVPGQVTLLSNAGTTVTGLAAPASSNSGQLVVVAGQPLSQ